LGSIIEDVDYYVATNMSPRTAADIAIERIGLWSNEDFFIVCHFKNPDAIGHRFGVSSKEYKQAMVGCDRHLGRILSKLSDEGILGETKIYVLSDHGFGTPRHESGTLEVYRHYYAPNTFIISNDENMTNIYMNEVAVFLLSNFGLPN